MAKELTELYWVEELLPEGTLRKHMFGGFSYYVDEKLVLLMFESSGSRVHRGKTYPFEIWNGCMFPTEKENQPQILSKFPFLVLHPILPKWLYIPIETEDFESNVQLVMRELRRQNPLLGTIPKSKGSKASKKGRASAEEKIDTRTPRMFSDEPSDLVFQKAKRISDLMNMGPETEKTMLKAGIKTPAELQKLGWKKAMIKLCELNPKNNHSIFAYVVIGALKNQKWNLISPEDKSEAQAFMKSLRSARRLSSTRVVKPRAKAKKKSAAKTKSPRRK